jgi:hypothetical protein
MFIGYMFVSELTNIRAMWPWLTTLIIFVGVTSPINMFVDGHIFHYLCSSDIIVG